MYSFNKSPIIVMFLQPLDTGVEIEWSDESQIGGSFGVRLIWIDNELLQSTRSNITELAKLNL